MRLSAPRRKPKRSATAEWRGLINGRSCNQRKRFSARELRPTYHGRGTSGRSLDPHSPPVDGEVIYEGEVYEGEVFQEHVHSAACDSGACDAIGSCGCDAIGCDAIGACGPSCGCSMCGEVPSGRAWRPAITLSLPQDGWVSVEALHMWQDGLYLPPLLTTSPNGTARADAGVLTRTGTTTVFGGGDVFDDSINGGRLRFGFWLDRCHTWGIGGEYMELEEQNLRFSQTSTGDPILARPFFNTLTGLLDSELVAFPGVVTGTATINVRSSLSGGSFYIRKMTCCSEGCREWLFCGCNGHYCTRSEFRIGYRYQELDEGVDINENLVAAPTDPGTFDITDGFTTLNQFNGLDLGWNWRLVRGYWNFDTGVRLAIGNTKQTVTVAGNSVIVEGTNPAENFDAGFLALSTNSGQFEDNQFSVLPELNLTLGYQLTDHLKATVGYTGIYWSNVVRPGFHIPTDVNTDFLPPVVNNSAGDPRPLFAFDTTDYWAHGISYGLEYRW